MLNIFDDGSKINVIDAEADRDLWMSRRATRLGASEFPIILGDYRYKSYEGLLNYFLNGKVEEEREWVEEVIFKPAHETEAIFKEVKDLKSLCLYNEKYIASLDAISFTDKQIFEIKNPRSSSSLFLNDDDTWCIHQLYMQARMLQIYCDYSEPELEEWMLNAVIIEPDMNYKLHSRSFAEVKAFFEERYGDAYLKDKLDLFWHQIKQANSAKTKDKWIDYYQLKLNLATNKTIFERENATLIAKIKKIEEEFKTNPSLCRSQHGYISTYTRSTVDYKKLMDHLDSIKVSLPSDIIKHSLINRVILK